MKNNLKYSIIEGLSGNNTTSETRIAGEQNSGLENNTDIQFTNATENDYTVLNNMIINSEVRASNISRLKTEMGENIENDILDNTGLIKTEGRLVDVARQDVQLMLIQQNTLYMLGTITIATLLITAILISK